MNIYDIFETKKGLYYNVNQRKKAGTSRSKNAPEAPSVADWKNAAKTAKEDINEGIEIVYELSEGAGQQLSVQQLAAISDTALDSAYGYGRSTPGNTFGWQANLKSASFAKQMIDRGITDVEAISDAIHKGWNVTAQAFVKNPMQFDDSKTMAPEKLQAKIAQRQKLMTQQYAQLPEDEKEKDRVVARAMLQAIAGEQGMAEGHADQVKKIVKKNGKPVGEIGTDPEASPGNGNWYVKHYASGYDVVGFDNAEEALEELKHVMTQGVAESLRPGEYHVWTVHFEDGTKGRIRVPNDEITDDQIKAHYAKRGKTVVKVDADWAVHSLDEAPVSNFMTAPQQPIDPREQWKRQVRAMAAQYQRNPSMLASLAKEAGPDSVEQVAWEYLQSAAKGIRMPGADTQPAPVNWDDVIRRLPQGLSGQALLNAAEEYLTGTKGMLRSQVRTLLNEPTNQRSLKGAYDRKLQPSESIDELAEAIDSRLYAMKLAGYDIL